MFNILDDIPLSITELPEGKQDFVLDSGYLASYKHLHLN